MAFSPDGKSFVIGYSDALGIDPDSATLRPVGRVLRGLGLPVAFSR